MKTIANITTGPARRALLAALAGLVVLGGCSRKVEQAAAAEGEIVLPTLPERSVEAAQDCLLVIWDNQAQPDPDFDRANDKAPGGAISCATGTSASQFEAALVALRAAAASKDRAALLNELNIPLMYIDEAGNRREVAAEELLDAGFDDVFSPEMLALMQQLDLKDMTVVPDQGGFFELGSIWLVANEPGGRPRLVTVNRQAFGEAAEAARSTAAREAEGAAAAS